MSTRDVQEVLMSDNDRLNEKGSTEGFEGIPAELCMKLLRESPVGLLALVGADAPALRPINFAVSRKRIVMRTGRGRLFEGACRGESASFVILEFDSSTHSGRSVIVKGRLSICDPTDSAIRTRIRSWSKTEKTERIILSIEVITGRRLLNGAG